MNRSKAADAINCLHGIRAYCTVMIIYSHAYYFRIIPYIDEEAVVEWRKSPLAMITYTVTLCVDFFFVMSAALMTRTMLKELDL